MSKENLIDRFGKCPMCGGEDIERDRTSAVFDTKNRTQTIKVFCENCADDFKEVYRFTGYKFDGWTENSVEK